nr:hypothetical protein [Tanacetum cinerariifolium]
MTKLILNEAQTEQFHAEPSIECNEKYELNEELLKELRCNSYSERVEEDVIGHIAKILEVLNPIDVDGLDPFQLRMITFPLSLSGNARKCNIPDDLGHETDYFEFLYWLTSKFDNHWELDKNVKNGPWEFYVNGQTNGTIDDLVNESCKESNKKTCSDSFFKPYLDAQDGKDIYEIISRDYSPIPIPTHRDINNPDELCQTEEFVVVRYSVGSSNEYIAVGPSKISTVEKPMGACLASTTNSSIRKIADGP